MKIIIKITKEVLQKTRMCGQKNDDAVNENCAIAYAIRTLFPEALVGMYVISFDGAQPAWSEITALLPITAQRFIEMFDESSVNDRLLLPEFSFEIEVPDSVIEKIGIKEATEIISKSSTLALV